MPLLLGPAAATNTTPTNTTTPPTNRPLHLQPLANWTAANIPAQHLTPYQCSSPDANTTVIAADCLLREPNTTTSSSPPPGTAWRHWEFESHFTFASRPSFFSSTLYLCSACGAEGGAPRADAVAFARPLFDAGDGAYRPHRAHAALFQRCMAATATDAGGGVGNVAVALQALLTVLLQGVYYEYLPVLSKAGEARVVFGAEMRVPVPWRGLGVVMGLLAVYAVTAGVVVVVFLAGRRAGERGGAGVGETWQAVAVCGRGGAVEGVVGGVGMKMDEQVEEVLKGEGVLVGLGRSEGGLPVVRRRVGKGM